MTRHRLLVLALGALAVVGTTVSTGGVSTAGADRGFGTAVVDDEHAYLGVDRTPNGTANGTTNLTVTVTNRFGGDVTFGLVTVEAGLADADGTIAMLSGGGSGSVTLNGVPCDGRVTVHAVGVDVEVVLYRAVAC